MSAYPAIMSFRQLLAALIALTVLFAPTVARAGEAYGAAPDHHAQMMQAGHCEPGAAGNEDGSAAMTCCVATAAAVAAVSPAAAEPQALPRTVQPPALASFLAGVPPEIATPPPRAA